MSARRQPSTTSLSKFERTNSPGTQNRSLDFCNSFWGLGDGGVDVLFARMRGAARTMEELRNYWKERAAIEEEYAKRMSKLSKMTLGRDEIGELRNSLDTIRLETDRQATFHLDISQQIRTELEAQAASFYARQMHHKKIHQSAIEKQFKAKQTQETYVNRAREKYEADCVRINSYTAQSSLVQGKDLDKVTLKLERAQQTVQANERDFANFAKALQDTTLKWEADWKSFADSCQDLEEYRLEFIKDNLWTYANAVSSVCVADDEACEKMRVALEQMEPEKEMANFVRDYGTGNQIPDPPAFVNYNTTEAIPSRPTSRPAQFQRATQREIVRQPAPASGEEDSGVNAAGVGAGGGARRTDSQIDAPPLTRRVTQSQARASMYGQQNGVQSNGHVSPQNSSAGPSPGPGSSQPMQRRLTATAQTLQSSRMPADPHAEAIDPNVATFIKVGNNAYPVDLSNDPQQHNGSSSRQQTSSPSKPRSGSIDPLAKHMEDLQNSISNSGAVRRNPTQRQSLVPEPRPQSSSRGETSLSPPSQNSALVGASSSPAQVTDYRNSAELVVGAHPSSRPASPNAITAAFMVPKPAVSPSGSEVVNEVLQDYQQSLPGERKSTSRRGSFAGPQPSSPANGNANGRPTHNSSMSQGQNLARPVSQLGHAGIGAHGSRSNSPQPISRGPSPAPNSVRNTLIAPPPAQSVARAPSPNTVGIALDPSGRVLHDDMAQIYHQQQQQQQVQQQRPTQQQPPPPPQIQPQQQQAQQQRRLSYNAIQAPPPPAAYGMTPPPPNPYSVQPAYAQPPTTQPPYPQNNMYYSQPPQQQPMYQQSQPGYAAVGGVQRGSGPISGSYFPGAPQQQLALQQQQPQRMSYQNTYRDPSPVGRSPSPQPGMPPPTGQTTEEGTGILFYVKALYDYTATIDEEFDFQAGDIIAVTATPEDGWWSGELLDEQRRQKGRHVFPSNFVCLF